MFFCCTGTDANTVLRPSLILCASAPGEGATPDTRFIEDGVSELLKTRRVLKCSYPYGFFLQQGSTQKEIFELMQVLHAKSQKAPQEHLKMCTFNPSSSF